MDTLAGAIDFRVAALGQGSVSPLRYFHESTTEWLFTVPTTSQPGVLAGLQVALTNTSGVEQWAALEFYAYDPSGQQFDEAISPFLPIQAGEAQAGSYVIYCAVPGDYRIKCKLVYENIGVVDEIDVVVAHVAGEAIVDVRIDRISFWNAAESVWVDDPPTMIAPGSLIGLKTELKNASDVPIIINAEVDYRSPTDETGIAPRISPVIDPSQKDIALEFQWLVYEEGKWKGDLIIGAGLPGQPTVEVDRREGIDIASIGQPGTISKMELEYDGARAAIPADDIPRAQRGLVHIWGRNNTLTTQRMGIQWIVRDPDGIVVEDYLTWEDWPYTGAGKEHEFIGGRFDMDKPGDWTIAIGLFMNPDSPVIVGSYEGILCTVTTELPPTYELLQHTIYPYYYVYDGPVENSVIAFTTDPFLPSAWMAEKMAASIESETKKKGGRVTELKVYVDKSPLLWTKFRVEITGTPLGNTIEAAPGVGIGVGIPIWIIIVILALAVTALLLVLTWAIETITKSFTHKPLSEEIKKTWSRETLISAIRDFETKLEHTPMPIEELNGMEDQELRDYCDHMAEEIVPAPEASLVALAVLGGLVVVGAGATYALVTRRKK